MSDYESVPTTDDEEEDEYEVPDVEQGDASAWAGRRQIPVSMSHSNSYYGTGKIERLNPDWQTVNKYKVERSFQGNRVPRERRAATGPDARGEMGREIEDLHALPPINYSDDTSVTNKKIYEARYRRRDAIETFADGVYFNMTREADRVAATDDNLDQSQVVSGLTAGDEGGDEIDVI